jgi:hypothetical protein
MTKYFCDRCRKVSDTRLNYVSFPECPRRLFVDAVPNTAELCDACTQFLIAMFRDFMEDFNGR